MKIRFTKLSDQEHRVQVIRDDGSMDEATLNSHSFLRHDFAHLAAEECVGLDEGFWGLVARGAPLNGEGMGGPYIQLAETLAGPIQTLMRIDAPVVRYIATLSHLLPDRDCGELGAAVHEKARQLQGHWQATAYGDTMEVEWTLK
jgi:hypothetical protein